LQATQEGLVPLKAWIKSALDHVIQACLGEPDLEFVWVGDDAVDPLQQAQTLNILVGAGIKTIAEARADLGLGAEAKAAPWLGKYNQNHDEAGRFTDAAHAVEPGAGAAKPPKGVQVAANDDPKTKSDAGGAVTVAGGPPEEELRPDEGEQSEGGTYFDPKTGRVITLPPGSAIGPEAGWINLGDLPQGPTFLSPPATSTWGDSETLDRHYIEHADDFGAQSVEDYAGQANEFFLRSDTEGYLKKVGRSGIIRIYDPKTNTFGAYNPNGTTRTFFKPTSPSYWDRQPGDNGGDDDE
jgi:hypothetical protein